MTAAVTVFALAFATGFSLYVALAVPGLAAHLELLTLPSPLAGLATPAVWGSLLSLAAIEAFCLRFRVGDLIWNGMHALARPFAAALLASALLAHLGSGARWLGSLAALFLTLGVHMAVMGTRIACRIRATEPARALCPSPGFLTALAVVASGTISCFALIAPGVTALVAWFALIAALPLLPGLWTAAYAALLALAAAVWLPGRGRPRWQAGLTRLPGSMRQALEARLQGPPNAARSARLTLARRGDRWPLCRGRLVISPDSPPLFVHGRFLHPEVLVLGQGRGQTDGELVLQTLRVEGPEPYALCVGPESPPARAILAALTGEEGIGGEGPSGAERGYKHM